MEKREICGVQASLLGFGCMRFPLKDGKIDETAADAMIDKAFASGINYFDTAYGYHGGESERFLGRALKKYPREDYLLISKYPVWIPKTRDDVAKIFYEQMDKLQTEYYDFYHLHAINRERWEKVKELGIIPFLEERMKEGKIRRLGFSFHDSFDLFKEIIEYRKWDLCQIQFNYMDTDIQAGLKGLELAESLGVPVVVMEPVKGGNIASLPPELAAPLMAAAPGKSMASWALRYVASFSGVKVILSGMSSMAQLEDNLATFNDYVPFTASDMALVKEVAAAMHKRTNNGCTGCAYCMPCPNGVDIPQCFKIWNENARYGNSAGSRASYSFLPDEARANNCLECGACEAQCPQGLSIIDDLKRIADEDWTK